MAHDIQLPDPPTAACQGLKAGAMSKGTARPICLEAFDRSWNADRITLVTPTGAMVMKQRSRASVRESHPGRL